jgi:hypothetical protein
MLGRMLMTQRDMPKKAQNYIYLSTRIRALSAVIGGWLSQRPMPAPGLTRKARGRDETVFNHSMITLTAVEYWARQIKGGERPALKQVQGYIEIYANALLVEVSSRRLIYLSVIERHDFEANLKIIHAALAPFQDAIPALRTRARTKIPNDVAVTICALAKMADDIQHHPDRLK